MPRPRSVPLGPPSLWDGCIALGRSIRSVHTTTLVIVGVNDPATTPADGRVILGAIAGSRMVALLAGRISAVETPDAFGREVTAFLAC